MSSMLSGKPIVNHQEPTPITVTEPGMDGEGWKEELRRKTFVGHMLFFYKNNLIRTSRLKFAKN